ncbi:MAG: hypothetical protein ACOC1F_03335, partial [Myxococcota bacterium]
CQSGQGAGSGGELIAFDEGCGSGAGWDWVDDDTARLCPDSCEQLKQGACEAVTATFGCKSIPVK